MSASQSNLSDPKYGYDLVVAVTQASINATMEQFLAGLTAPVVICCYVYDANNDLVPIDYATLKANAKGSDPFTVPPTANPNTDQDLINLTAANFAGAFMAQLGLPNVPLANIPALATLGNGTNAPVLFNLLCAQFQITGFEYGPRGSVTWINQSQPNDGTGSPWYFSANVSLNNGPINPSTATPVVQSRYQQLVDTLGPGAFSIQQLFLDLDTAILQSTPTIVGIPVGWPVWNLITTVFLGAYFTQLKQNGQPVLGYSVQIGNPIPSTLQLGALSFECCALQDNGQPIVNPTPAQQDAATFNYLGTTSTTPPTPVMFPWNWVELADVSNFSGVQAIRRDVFFNFFAGLLNQDVGPLCQDTTVSLTHSGDTYYISYYSTGDPNPSTFQAISPIGPPGPDGFTDLLTLSFSHNSSDDSEAADHMSSIYGNFNFALNGTVSAMNNQIRILITAAAYMEFNHHELGINYNDLAGANYYDKTLTVIYTLGVGQNGNLVVTQTNSIADNSAPWNFTPGGILGLFGLEDDLQTGMNQVITNLSSYLDSAFAAYVNEVTDEINGYQGWVFPGASSFLFKNVSFSVGQDLITELTYADPSLMAQMADRFEARMK